jgi:lipopolysaccharide biosynthesis regulator YciM
MALAGGLPEPIRKKALENLAVVYRRAGEHDRSREMCEQLIRYPEFSMTGYEGAAIYHERVDRDLEAALNVLEEGLARAQNKRCRMMLQGRWDRLQQKIMKYE